MSTPRRMEIEVELDASPEQVWEAISTGPGISSWFVPTVVEPHESAENADDAGRIRQDFGSGFVVDGRLTAWEPGRRLEYGRFAPDADSPEATQPEGAQPSGPDYAFEFVVEGRAGGSTVMRFVQSGFLDTDGWEAEYDSFEHGWAMFFANLAAYLEHFAGRPVHNAMAMGYTATSPAQAWEVFHQELGLDKRPAVGDQVRLTPDGPPEIVGVVDFESPQFLGVRTADALHRFGAEGSETCGVSAYHYFFGDDLDADVQARWQEWINRLFPMPQPAQAR